jgi:spermidine synthase
VVWLRRITELFGASAFAASATLAAFMAGLGIGGYVGGRWAARVRSPLAWYGWLEIALVPAVVFVELLLAAADPLVTRAYGAGLAPSAKNALRAVLALVVLLPPTMLIGATLPLLAQAIVRSRVWLARPLGTGLEGLACAPSVETR